MNKLNLKSLGLIVLFATGGLASANLINNGDFETGNFTGWTTTPAGNGSLFFVGTDSPHTGTYAAEFLAFEEKLDAISQTFATTVGVTYDLSYWLLNNTRNDLNEFRVTFGGVVVQDLLAAPSFPYAQYNFSMLATGSSTTLEFAGRNASGWFAVDDVSVKARAASGVPEAGGSALLLGVAMVGLGFLRRKMT